MTAIATLPRITFVTKVQDFGPGGASCPHCGAIGRWVTEFVCEDGETRGAMRGCIKLYPQGPFVTKSIELLDKERKEAEGMKGYRLNKWDIEQLAAINSAQLGNISIAQAMEIIRTSDKSKKNWMKSRGYAR